MPNRSEAALSGGSAGPPRPQRIAGWSLERLLDGFEVELRRPSADRGRSDEADERLSGDVEVAPATASSLVTGVTHDSAGVRPGDLFAALPGSRIHGARFARQAAAAGAVAALTDEAGAAEVLAAGLPAVVTPDPRGLVGPLAARVYGDPSSAMTVIGITGTNGKTTTAHLVEAGLIAAGHVTGVLGTVEARLAGESIALTRTTPEAADLQALLASARERGVTALVMEVSSHALTLDRVAGVRFDVAAFTNLGRDPLDFHGWAASPCPYHGASGDDLGGEDPRGDADADAEWSRALDAGRPDRLRRRRGRGGLAGRACGGDAGGAVL
jgi:hypothetical protein